MYSKKSAIRNKTGLHARPASDFIAAASKFKSEITIKSLDDDGAEANAKSIIMLLSLGLSQGTNIEITASGEDEREAVETLVGLIEGGFGESEQQRLDL